jgi:hypothetical protein
METESLEGLTLFFDAEERDAAVLVGQACIQSVPLIREQWGLDTPRDLRVYVMTSWRRFFFHSAPWPWQILLATTVPLWAPRVKRTWPSVNGWTQGYGQRRAVGVKPPRLIEMGSTQAADRIFCRPDSLETMVRQVTCHELVHAFSTHLKLPMWLNEGLATTTVDHLAGKPTIQPSTVETLGSSAYGSRAEQYRRLRSGDLEGLVYHFVRGYWLTRYLEETQPGLLASLLSRRHGHKALETRIAAAYGLSYEAFWRQIDGMVALHFRQDDDG